MSRMISMIRSEIRTITSAVLYSSVLKAGLVLALCVNMICGPVVASGALPVRFPHTDRIHKAPTAVPANAGPPASISEEKKHELIERKDVGHLPLSFEANTGQTDARVKFLSRGSNYGFYLTSDEAVMVFRSHKQRDSKTKNAHPPGSPKQREVVRMKLVGVDEDIQPQGCDELTSLRKRGR